MRSRPVLVVTTAAEESGSHCSPPNRAASSAGVTSRVSAPASSSTWELIAGVPGRVISARDPSGATAAPPTMPPPS